MTYLYYLTIILYDFYPSASHLVFFCFIIYYPFQALFLYFLMDCNRFPLLMLVFFYYLTFFYKVNSIFLLVCLNSLNSFYSFVFIHVFIGRQIFVIENHFQSALISDFLICFGFFYRILHQGSFIIDTKVSQNIYLKVTYFFISLKLMFSYA